MPERIYELWKIFKIVTGNGTVFPLFEIWILNIRIVCLIYNIRIPITIRMHLFVVSQK